MSGLTASYTVSANDYGGERTNTQYGLPAQNDTTVAATETLLGDLRAAHMALTLGVLVQGQFVYRQTKYAPSNIKATNKEAQREKKWLIRYYDNVTFAAFVVEIGNADLSKLGTDGDRVNLATGSVPAGVWTTYKDAFEAVCYSPDGNPCTLVEAVFVGRNT